MTRWEIVGFGILMWMIVCGTFLYLWKRFWDMIKEKEKSLTPLHEARDDSNSITTE